MNVEVHAVSGDDKLANKREQVWTRYLRNVLFTVLRAKVFFVKSWDEPTIRKHARKDKKISVKNKAWQSYRRQKFVKKRWNKTCGDALEI